MSTNSQETQAHRGDAYDSMMTNTSTKPTAAEHDTSAVNGKSSSSIQYNIVRERPRETRHYLPILIFLIYATIVLLSWTLLCITRDRPIREKGYFSDPGGSRSKFVAHLMSNERFIHAAQVLRTLASLLTVPVTAYVCRVCAMMYMQAAGGDGKGRLSAEKAKAVAEGRWVSPRALVHAGSVPLYVGGALIVVGVLSQLLQAGFIDQENFQAASYRTTKQTSYPELLNTRQTDPRYGRDPTDSGRFILDLQNTIASSPDSSYSYNLWSHCIEGTNCLDYSFNGFGYSGSGKGPRIHYMVPFPTNFSTGVFPSPQFAPRINTTLTYTNITKSDFQQDCNNKTDTDAFYAHYAFQSPNTPTFTVEVCIPGNLTRTPWKTTRDRQDISETLYFSFVVENSENITDLGPIGGWYKAVANTTFGYFELPNKWNNYIAGPIVSSDPLRHGNREPSPYKRAENSSSYAGDVNLSGTVNLGPLSSLGLALFDSTSFVGSRVQDGSPSAANPSSISPPPISTKDTSCKAVYPFQNTLSGAGCPGEYGDGAAAQVYTFMKAFTALSYSKKDFRTVGYLETGLNVTNYMFITGHGIQSGWFMSVNVDDGVWTVRARISRAGVVVGSVFLGMHLFGLLAVGGCSLVGGFS